MQFQTLAVLAASLAVAECTGWTVPKGQPDGVYSVSTNPDGSVKHTLIGGTTDKVARSISRVEVSRRGNTGVTCDGFILPTQEDITCATQALALQCGNSATVGSGLDYYSIHGEVTAFYCNFSGGTTQCTAGDANSAFGSIQSVCSSAGSGYTVFPFQEYGYAPSGSDFCGRGV